MSSPRNLHTLKVALWGIKKGGLRPRIAIPSTYFPTIQLVGLIDPLLRALQATLNPMVLFLLSLWPP